MAGCLDNHCKGCEGNQCIGMFILFLTILAIGILFLLWSIRDVIIEWWNDNIVSRCGKGKKNVQEVGSVGKGSVDSKDVFGRNIEVIGGKEKDVEIKIEEVPRSPRTPNSKENGLTMFNFEHKLSTIHE